MRICKVRHVIEKEREKKKEKKVVSVKLKFCLAHTPLKNAGATETIRIPLLKLVFGHLVIPYAPPEQSGYHIRDTKLSLY